MSKHLEAGGREMFTNGLIHLDHFPRNQSHIFLTLPPYAKNKSLNVTGGCPVNIYIFSEEESI